MPGSGLTRCSSRKGGEVGGARLAELQRPFQSLQVFGRTDVEGRGKPAFWMDVVDVEATAAQTYRPGAFDLVALAGLADRGHVPADRRIDRAETKRGSQRPDSRPDCASSDFHASATGPPDGSTAHWTLLERTAEIAEIFVQAAPSFGRIDAVGFDQPVIVVERLVARVARQPSRGGQQRSGMLIAGARRYAGLRRVSTACATRPSARSTSISALARAPGLMPGGLADRRRSAAWGSIASPARAARIFRLGSRSARAAARA